MKKDIINATPHAINVAGVSYEPSGLLPRVAAQFTEIEDGFTTQSFGEVEGLPERQDNTLIIVSAMVFGASGRDDLVAPATGHPDVIRNEKGHIVSVPALVRR